ncbi:alkaline shock response membrane anchor protein AmaP [Leuconostoc falkenbergense]|uniref:alkaline shock response membrane anchor protein AmaP n=1 Tax=Leuconostoc falkenbergense TaxID=2766470 RepID=UPI0021AAF60A|nr:alkaline shock response membrane anchor protein AmaP [Leuconostoc falkenbergense]MCT4410811.1 alkaline shock response membrane anchor protein AmaP [Leuconostoc falkenbergense]
MRKTIKIFLILIIFIYVVGICLLIWPEVLESLFWSLKRLGINFSGNTDMIRYYYGVVLLSLSVIALLIVLLIPNQLPDILLERTKTGRLALSNYGVKQFIRTQLSGEGLSNIQVKLKNTHRQKKFYIVADAAYKRSVVKELPRISNQLTNELTNLLGDHNTPVKVSVKVNQKSTKNNHLAPRVV